MPVPVETLSRHSFLSGIDPWYLEQLARYAEAERYQKGDFIFRQGEKAEKFFLIVKGSVALELRTEGRGDLVIETLGQQNILGWSWLIPPHRWHFDARAVTPVEAVALHGSYLRTKCQEDPKLGYEIMKRFSGVIVDRLLSTRMQLLEKYQLSNEEND